MVESSEPVIDKEEKENIQTEDENNQQNGNKKNRPTPETVAMDRGVQNIARKAHKNSKGDDKKLGMSNILLFYCFPLFLCNTISEKNNILDNSSYEKINKFEQQDIHLYTFSFVRTGHFIFIHLFS